MGGARFAGAGAAAIGIAACARQAPTDISNADLGPAVDELVAAGATGSTLVTVRSWHHVTWNNCLVENSAVRDFNRFAERQGAVHCIKKYLRRGK